MDVIGAIDDETRCKHYHSENDRIAIKFYCCKQYFSCIKCHAEHGCGHKQVWPQEKFDVKAILCGTCGYELTIKEYLHHHTACPSCGELFNKGCSRHHQDYFQV